METKNCYSGIHENNSTERRGLSNKTREKSSGKITIVEMTLPVETTTDDVMRN